MRLGSLSGVSLWSSLRNSPVAEPLLTRCLARFARNAVRGALVATRVHRVTVCSGRNENWCCGKTSPVASRRRTVPIAKIAIAVLKQELEPSELRVSLLTVALIASVFSPLTY